MVPLDHCTPQAIRSSGVLGRSALYIRPEHDIYTDSDSTVTLSESDNEEQGNSHGASANKENAVIEVTPEGTSVDGLDDLEENVDEDNIISPAPNPPQVQRDHCQLMSAEDFFVNSPLADSDDEDNRLASPVRRFSRNEQKDLVTILKEFRKDNLDLHTNTTVVAQRKKITQSACRALERSYFEWHKVPNIEFISEMAEDHGGPRREFFRLLMEDIQHSLGTFEGKPGNLFFYL